ncbi:MAG TPA: protein-export chaperone SecB [Spirochaetota bacterium]|jgi:preprotein translocase subunit SecB|nr:protein-export chaperone SecB [Spirochaetota bacterium]HOH36561.1 protein-export chaperone SecB [Spirochaetota bacterium]HPJ13552.1 protein-export chaperone SecB [Spirochaetota bacterium]HPM33297.1 protein-export chaperone SecB [Spirochaetota bacterium]HPY02543.1 protein-export chaperone SecB [Spirochaetota bacterium]
MKESNFQLKEQRLLSIKYDFNESFESDSIQLDISSNIEIAKNEEKQIAFVKLTMNVFSTKEIKDVPFKISVTNRGVFSWKDYDEKALETLLNYNAPAILLSYQRSVVSQITAFSSITPLILPLFDFTKN